MPRSPIQRPANALTNASFGSSACDAASAAAVTVAPSSETKAPQTIPTTRAKALSVKKVFIDLDQLADESATSEDICLRVEGAKPNSAGTEIPSSLLISRM